MLYRLMGGISEDDLNQDVAKYYATRGKLTHRSMEGGMGIQLMGIQLLIRPVRRATWR